MPFVADYDSSEEEDDAGSHGSSGGAPGGSVGGAPVGGGSARQAQGTHQQEKAFVPWSRFVDANKSESDRAAGQLNSNVQGQMSRAKKAQEDASHAFGEGIESNYTHWGDEKQPSGGFGQPAAPQQPQGRLGKPEEAEYGFQPQAAHPEPAATAFNPDTKTVPGAEETPMFNAKPQPRTRTGLRDGAIDAPQGSESLEAMLGPEAWDRLMGATQNAEASAGALGTETGVQALLQRQGASPSSAFDAALINGAGGEQFGATAKQGKGLADNLSANNTGAQDAWHKLMGDVAEAKRERSATAEADAFNATQRPQGDAATPTAPGEAPPKWHPGDYENLKEFMDEGSPGQYAHEAGMYMSPADWATRLAGELGYNGENTSQLFVKGVSSGAADGNKDLTWNISNLRQATRLVQEEYGQKAVEEWFNHMTPEMWQAYMNLGNAGAQAREMRAWLESAHYQKGGIRTDNLGNMQLQAVSEYGQKAWDYVTSHMDAKMLAAFTNMDPKTMREQLALWLKANGFKQTYNPGSK